MPQHPNTQRLHNLMETHQVSLKDVASLTRRTYNTVRQWRGCRSQPIPSTILELLELKLSLRCKEKAV